MLADIHSTVNTINSLSYNVYLAVYLYLEACFKTTLLYFGKAFLDKPSTILPTEGIMLYKQHCIASL